MIRHLRRRRDDTVHLLDLGCSYGVNAALLKHDLSMEDLYEHWGQQDLADAAPEEFVAHNQSLFADLDESGGIEVIGSTRPKTPSHLPRRSACWMRVSL